MYLIIRYLPECFDLLPKWTSLNLTKTAIYPLASPRPLKIAVELQSKKYSTSINQFVAAAVAEKPSTLQTAEFFATRKARADFKAFDKLIKRRRGQPLVKATKYPGA